MRGIKGLVTETSVLDPEEVRVTKNLLCIWAKYELRRPAVALIPYFDLSMIAISVSVVFLRLITNFVFLQFEIMSRKCNPVKKGWPELGCFLSTKCSAYGILGPPTFLNCPRISDLNKFNFNTCFLFCVIKSCDSELDKLK